LIGACSARSSAASMKIPSVMAGHSPSKNGRERPYVPAIHVLP
jgi:hypothetical protein